MPGSNVIPFPTTPVFADPRKRGARSTADLQQPIASNMPDLMANTRLDIVRMWRRQVQIGWIAKIHQLTVVQTEAVLWAAHHGYDPVVSAREFIETQRRAA